MSRNASVVIYIAVMILLIVGIDVLFFRQRFQARLIANGCIVTLSAGYIVFLAKR
jgi:hypothetical protein